MKEIKRLLQAMDQLKHKKKKKIVACNGSTQGREHERERTYKVESKKLDVTKRKRRNLSQNVQ